MMPVWVKGGDVRSETKSMLVTAGYGRHKSQWVNTRDYQGKRVNLPNRFSN